MSDNWRAKASSRLKKNEKKFFNFTDEETTFDVKDAVAFNSDIINTASNSIKRPEDVPANVPISDIQISNTNDLNTSHKQDTNPLQTGHKQVTELDHIKTQTGHNEDTNRSQIIAPIAIQPPATLKQDTNPLQTGHNEVTKRDTEPSTKRDTKSSLNLTLDQQIQSLKGNSARLFINLCERSISSGSTEIITTYHELSFTNSIARGSIETTLKRLCINKGLLSKRADGGGAGARVYINMNHEVLVSFSKHKSLLQTFAQTGHKQVTERDTEPSTKRDTNPSSKLVSNINNNLTNSLEPKVEKPTWFKDLNFTPVHPIGPMQVNSSIRDLVQERLNPDTVQEFLNKFKSWLAQQSRIQNPLAMFCEKLKELAVEGDSAILACMTEEERQIELEFAQQIEKAKAEMALIVKSKEQSAKQEFESRFESWYAQTSRSEHESLQASTGLIEYGSEIYKNVLRQKFREQQEG